MEPTKIGPIHKLNVAKINGSMIVFANFMQHF